MFINKKKDNFYFKINLMYIINFAINSILINIFLFLNN